MLFFLEKMYLCRERNPLTNHLILVKMQNMKDNLHEKIHSSLLLLLALALLFPSCHKKEKVTPPKLTKVQETKAKEVAVTVKRYEQELFSLDVNHLADGIEQLYGKYPENLIAKDCWKDRDMMAGLKGYLTDPTIKNLYQETQKQYGDMEDVTAALNKAMKNYLTHFPDAAVPTIYTLVPGMDFNLPSVFGYDNDLFVCLDMYLGKDCKYYALAGMPKFIAARCERNFIPLDCFTKGLAYKHLPEKTPVTALDNMIFEGKKLFFTATMFPDATPQEILGYSEDKYQWATQYEKKVWQYLIKQNMIYSKDDEVIRRLVDETPFTRDFGNSSPGRLGAFIGLHIVSSYMKNHPETTLQEMMALTNSQQFLTESLYKP